jgi:CubicO group peptidase (beta-lactamase class C family)
VKDLCRNLKEFDNAIAAAYPNVYSVMIYQNNKQIFENYYRKAKPDDRRSIASCNKSVLSVMAGIAIEKGYIKSVDQHILDFFPEYLHAGSDPNILRLRINHLLTMTTGFYYQRLAADSQPVAERMKSYDDWIKYILDLPITSPDLSTFCYSNFEAMLLSAIIIKASGIDVAKFANKYLFAPLGFGYIDWQCEDPKKVVAGSLDFTTHEMAAIGLLYLNKGHYNGQQIVSGDWVAKSQMNYGGGYGYMWWVKSDGTYMASGGGGSMIMVLPNEKAVVVSQCKGLRTNWKSPYHAVNEYLTL